MSRNRIHFRNVLNNVTKFIFTHQSGARFSRQLRVKALFNTFYSLPVDIGKADQIGRYVSGRVKTARLFPQVNTR
ncbi:Uncharacterised protein [Salmonella enterica subsp. enterica serovar Bovismorbificans]|uniref:Uncharacterized protein n=1 Tax=Salmonella enterica subsp. enterica serovar Bovismorbificans TaxID=58097 RepID=A0A655CY77_SALET|nr:Uncharacterised protein [Salmonella enterica subsp. enterica serovar Bovismorbificans]